MRTPTSHMNDGCTMGLLLKCIKKNEQELRFSEFTIEMDAQWVGKLLDTSGVS